MTTPEAPQNKVRNLEGVKRAKGPKSTPPQHDPKAEKTAIDARLRRPRQKVTRFISRAAAAVRQINDDALLMKNNWDTITADEAGVMLKILRQYPQCERFDSDIPKDSREAVDLAFTKLRNALTERARMEVDQ